MPRFHCTKQLLSHLGVGVMPSEVAANADEGPEPRLGNWYANLIKLERRTAVLYTNEATLFSFVILKVTARRPDLFAAGFVRGLMLALGLEGHDEATIAAIVLEYAIPTYFAKAQNRQVIGSMNAIAQDLDHMIWYNRGLAHSNISELVHRLNNTPWGATGYKFASELVRELLGARRQ